MSEPLVGNCYLTDDSFYYFDVNFILLPVILSGQLRPTIEKSGIESIPEELECLSLVC